jgi:hypothetical protein
MAKKSWRQRNNERIARQRKEKRLRLEDEAWLRWWEGGQGEEQMRSFEEKKRREAEEAQDYEKVIHEEIHPLLKWLVEQQEEADYWYNYEEIWALGPFAPHLDSDQESWENYDDNNSPLNESVYDEEVLIGEVWEGDMPKEEPEPEPSSQWQTVEPEVKWFNTWGHKLWIAGEFLIVLLFIFFGLMYIF